MRCIPLQAMKRRLGSKVASGIFFTERPFFNVDVELKVRLQPCLLQLQLKPLLCSCVQL